MPMGGKIRRGGTESSQETRAYSTTNDNNAPYLVFPAFTTHALDLESRQLF
jgi:hypothetical protein